MSTYDKGLTIKELYDLFSSFNRRSPEFFNPLMVYDQNNDTYWYAKRIDYYEEDDGSHAPVIFLAKKEDINPDADDLENLKYRMVNRVTIIQSTIISLTVSVALSAYICNGKGDCEIPIIFEDDVYYIKGAILVKKSSYIFGKYLPTFELIVDR